MGRIDKEYKTKLGEMLGEWYRRFGKIAPRRAYRDDDDEGGSGSASASPFESHPLLDQLPVGASSDLASTIINNSQTLEEAERRIEESSPQLQNKLEQALQLGKKYENQHRNRPRPL